MIIIVGHFKHSSNVYEKLKDFQLQMNLPSLKVKQDWPTRWNSSFLMLERLEALKPLFIFIFFLFFSFYIYLQIIITYLQFRILFMINTNIYYVKIIKTIVV